MLHSLSGVGRTGAVLTFAAGIGLAGAAEAWEPTEEVQIVAHAGTNSSTWAFANAVAKAIRDNELFPHGVNVQIVEGARGGKARAFVSGDHEGDPHYLQILTPSQINNPILVESPVNYERFRGVAMLLVSPKVLTVNADSPYQTMEDLIEDAKQRPAEILQGGGQIGATASLTNRILEDDFDIDLTYTPFEDQGVLQLVGGHVDFIIEQPEQVAKFVESDDLRIIAASDKLSEYPDVPTFEEAGYDFLVLNSYRGFWTSDDVSDEAVEYYINVFDQVRETESFKDYMAANQMTELWITGADLDAFLEEQHDAYFRLDTEMGLIGQ